jgi:2-polyprenyl-3-methyl-5-hydroxy-6-metoxy-1,4-benzoquinol methylase
MFLYALKNKGNEALARVQYLKQGKRIAQVVRRIGAWCLADTETPKVLDFAAGFGRATRYISRDFSSENVWVSDLQPHAVDFCKTTFGVNGFDSVSDPSALNVPERFHLIVVSSLFSHLPQSTFRAWLARLADMLAPGGVLTFSVHGADMADAASLPPDGHLFVAGSESLVLAPNEYGTAYVTDAFVRSAIADVFGAGAFVRLLPKGLCGVQDLYIVSLEARRRVAELPILREPVGSIEHCTLAKTGQFRVNGWAACVDPDDPVDHIFVEVDGQRIAISANQIRRADVATFLGNPALEACGFDVDIGIQPPYSPMRVVIVTACTANGCHGQLLAAPLADLRQKPVHRGFLWRKP